MENNKIFGFWIYLMSDFILFAALFSVYFVLKENSSFSSNEKDIFDLSLVLIETIFLLFSSVTYSIATLYIKENKLKVIIWLILTFLFGLLFTFVEVNEFYELLIQGYKPNISAFFSIFFTLVGFHGLHVITGLSWILVMILHIYISGLTELNQIRLKCLGLFWHFLDIVWIFVFNIVYLMDKICG